MKPRKDPFPPRHPDDVAKIIDLEGKLGEAAKKFKSLNEHYEKVIKGAAAASELDHNTIAELTARRDDLEKRYGELFNLASVASRSLALRVFNPGLRHDFWKAIRYAGDLEIDPTLDPVSKVKPTPSRSSPCTANGCGRGGDVTP